MKRIIFSLLIISFSLVSFGQSRKETLGMSTITLSSEIWSQYHSEGRVHYNKPVLWTDLNLIFHEELYFNLWWSSGLEGSGISSDYGDEIQYILGRKIEFDEKLYVDFGYGYYDTVEVGELENDIFTVFAEFGYHIKTVSFHTSPYIKFQLNEDLDSQSKFNNSYIYLGNRNISRLGDVQFDKEMCLLYDAGGIEGLDSGVFAQYLIEFKLRKSDRVSITLAQAKITTPLTSVDDDRDTVFVYGAGISIEL
jgi:hypothetical protein